MKTILKIILILTALITISCDNMYNDLAYEIDAEYNYFLASTDPTVHNIKTYPLFSDGLPNFSNVKNSINVTVSPYFPAAHPTGKFLYVPIPSSNLLYTFKVNDDGSLNSLGSFTTSTLTPWAVKVHPTGKYVYIIDNNISATIVSMLIVKSDGTLIDNGTIPSGVRQLRLAINPAGTCLYVVCGNAPSLVIYAYKIENNGKLTLINTVSPANPNNQSITDINIHPNGKYIYVARLNGFDKYNFKSNGDIDLLSISSVTTSAGAGYIATQPSGNFLYYIGDDANMRSYKINSNGVASTNNQISCNANIRDLIIHPQGKYLYAASTSDSELFYITINDDGKVNSSSFTSVTPLGLALIRKRKE